MQSCIHLSVQPPSPDHLLSPSPHAGEAEMNGRPVLQGAVDGRCWNPDSQPDCLTSRSCPNSGALRPKRETSCTSAVVMRGAHSRGSLGEEGMGRPVGGGV